MSDDLRERVAAAMWNSRGNGDWNDATNTALIAIYRNLADAALAEIGVSQNQLDEAINQLDNARHSVDVLERRIAAMGGVREAALREIAAQKNSDELSRDEWDVADFTGGYDECINKARSALNEGD